MDITLPYGQLLTETTGTNTTAYTYGLERISALNGSLKTQYVYDGRGSVAQAIANSGVQSFAYTPFGEMVGSKKTGFGFNAEWYDAATGMQNLRARQYEPAMGRFNQKDVVRGWMVEPLSLNRYVYVLNDPINFIDPSGMFLAAVAKTAVATAKATVQKAIMANPFFSKAAAQSAYQVAVAANAGINSRITEELAKVNPKVAEALRLAQEEIARAKRAGVRLSQKQQDAIFAKHCAAVTNNYKAYWTRTDGYFDKDGDTWESGTAINEASIVLSAMAKAPDPVNLVEIAANAKNNDDLASQRMLDVFAEMSGVRAGNMGEMEQFVSDILKGDITDLTQDAIATMLHRYLYPPQIDWEQFFRATAVAVLGAGMVAVTIVSGGKVILLVGLACNYYSIPGKVATLADWMAKGFVLATAVNKAFLTAAEVQEIVTGDNFIKDAMDQSTYDYIRGATDFLILQLLTAGAYYDSLPQHVKDAFGPSGTNVLGNKGFLQEPEKRDGTLNIGAGKRPMEGAYNVDINPSAPGVHAGDAMNLSKIQTGSQSKVIIQNPYGYDALNPEIKRVLASGGTVEISGGMSNKYFNSIYNMSEADLKSLGYTVVSRGVADNPGVGLSSSGGIIESIIMEIVLKKE